MKKTVDKIVDFAQKIGNEDQKEMAFLEAFEEAFKPMFNTFTGKEYDSTLVKFYPKEWQVLISTAKAIFRDTYSEMEKQGLRKIASDQISKEIQIVEYSEKSFALIGQTQHIKDKFKVDDKFIGRFNRGLLINGVKRPGWIFPLKHKAFVIKLIANRDIQANPFMEGTNDEETQTLF